MKHDVASFAIQARQLLLPLQPLSPFVFSIFDEGLLLVQLQSAQHTSIGTRVLLYSPLVGCAIGLVFTLQGIVRTCLRYATAHKLLAVRDIHCSTDSMQMCISTIAHTFHARGGLQGGPNPLPNPVSSATEIRPFSSSVPNSEVEQREVPWGVRR